MLWPKLSLLVCTRATKQRHNATASAAATACTAATASAATLSLTQRTPPVAPIIRSSHTP